MRQLKRAVHIDFHTMPNITDFGDGWDAKEFARILKEAGVTCINAFAQCNIGFSYYNTKIGIPYPQMQGDMLGAIIEECHKVDIAVIAYINVGLNHELSRKHADWLRVDKDGRIIRGDRTGNFFRTMCYNTDYKEYLLSIIAEIAEYDIDGLFCDCMTLEPCHCDKCTSDMLEKGINISDETAVTQFSKQIMLSISKDIRNLIPDDKFLYLNGMPYYAVKDFDSHIEIECLPSGGWGYDFFWPHISYARNIKDTVLYMTGRFQASWGDFGGYKTKESIENDFYDALCNNAGVSLGDHMHPAKNLIPDIYSDLGDIYHRIEKYEPWTTGAKYCSDIGVITNSDGYLSGAYSGLSRILGELKYSYDIVNEDMDFSKFSVLILPDDLHINEKLASKLKIHLNAGKKVISSGSAGLNVDETGFALPEWDFKFDGLDCSTSPYFHLTQPIEKIADMDWACYKPGIFMYASDKDYIIADYVKPYFEKHWDGLHGYFYTPPLGKDGHTAVAVSSNGNVAHICFKIFEAYNQDSMLVHKEIIRKILKQFLPNPLIKADSLPSTARATLTGSDSYKLLHVKVTYPEPRGRFDIVEEHTVLPAGREIAVRGTYENICILPSQKALNCKADNGYTKIILPEITGYEMFLLK